LNRTPVITQCGLCYLYCCFQDCHSDVPFCLCYSIAPTKRGSLTHLNPFVLILRILRRWFLWSEFEGRLASVCNEIVLLATIFVQWLTLLAL
jgi:ABC-type polysaccharide/polyol phosphate export permease